MPYSNAKKPAKGNDDDMKRKFFATVALAFVCIVFVIYMFSGPPKVVHKSVKHLQDPTAYSEEKDVKDDWLPSQHTPTENKIHTEEMMGEDGETLKNNAKGMRKKAKMFFKQDRNRDGFLAGADIPVATLELLDANKDQAVSFDEWTHGFDHVAEKTKVKAFQKYYGLVFGSKLPKDWSHREEYRTDVAPDDDRHHQHEMDLGDIKQRNMDEFNVADTNGDGKLSASEADTIGLRDEEGSVKSDKNRDGYVSIDEYTEWMG